MDNQITMTDAGFSEYNTKNINFPVLVSVPHAGRVYPAALLQNLKIPPAELLRLEDRYADRLAANAISCGFPAIVAHKPRAWLDLNRKESEIDPAIVQGISAADLPAPTRKLRGGLGLVPRRLNLIGDLWKNHWHIDDIEQRISLYHQSYHSLISGLLTQIRDKFGVALLLDLHSMPPLDIDGDIRSEDESHLEGHNIVVGDRFGRSASGRYSELAISFFQDMKFSVQLNHPYAGGYVLERHGNPAGGIHALQLEVDRACYLDSHLREPIDNIVNISRNIGQLAQLLSSQLSAKHLLAAE